jgi:hypothetical protein
MVTRTGLESACGHASTGTYEARDGAGRGGTGPADASGRVATDTDGTGLPSAVPSFLEACAKLAGEAAARGDFTRARELVEKAARVAALRPAVA